MAPMEVLLLLNQQELDLQRIAIASTANNTMSTILIYYPSRNKYCLVKLLLILAAMPPMGRLVWQRVVRGSPSTNKELPLLTELLRELLRRKKRKRQLIRARVILISDLRLVTTMEMIGNSIDQINQVHWARRKISRTLSLCQP